MAEKKKIVTSKDKQGVKPTIVVPQDKRLGTVSKAEAKKIIEENNAKASLSKAAFAGDHQALKEFSATLGFKLTPIGEDKQPKGISNMNRPELIDVAKDEGVEIEESDTVAILKEKIAKSRESK